MRNARSYVGSVMCALAVAAFAAGQTSGEERPAAGAAPRQEAGGAEAEHQAQPAGILPVPDYSGDLWTRSFLTGDWGGARRQLADKGIQLEVDFVQFVQSVTSGGSDTGTKYGGNLDYLIYLDLYRMKILPGAMVKIRAQTRYGETANDIAGSLLPVNTYGLFPLTEPLDEVVPITVTDLTYFQFLSEKFGVFLGKFDVFDGDPSEFASGRGTTQFLNSNFVFNPVGVVPTLLTGFVGAGNLSQGIEAYYNIAITPAAHLTFDLQWVESGVPNVDPAVLLGARLDLTF